MQIIKVENDSHSIIQVPNTEVTINSVVQWLCDDCGESDEETAKLFENELTEENGGFSILDDEGGVTIFLN